MELAADKTGIEGAGEGGVGGALDESAAIGKDGERVDAVLEAEQVGVRAGVAERG